MHTFVSVVVIVNHLLCFLARDTYALREAEGFYGVGDGEVDYLCEAASLFQFFFCLGIEDKPRRALVYIVAFLESVEHDWVVRDVREQTKFELRIIGGD